MPTATQANIEGKMVEISKVRPCRNLYCMKHADHCCCCNRPLTVDGKCVKACDEDTNPDDTED